MLIDTHCHLNLLEGDTKDIIRDAVAAGVEKIIVPSIDVLSSKNALAMAKEYPEVYAAVGFHPNYLHTADLENIELINQLAVYPEVVAIGEIGLDFYREKDNTVEQTRIFEHFCSIATQEAKPVIVHSRAADDATLDILRLFQGDGLRGVWHCYQGDMGLAEKILNLGFYIGFTGSITFSDDPEITEVIAQIPSDRILIETDAPYLAPIPHRGKTNQPAFLVEVARRAAAIRGLEIEKLAEITTANAVKLFNL